MQDSSPRRDLRGILLLDKPGSMTSNRALQRAKRLFRARKAGHTGSLDPLATGMLPVCFGAATKLSQFLLDARKTYRVVGRLGIATDTGDAEGQQVARIDSPAPAREQIAAALEQFRGETTQIPPMYSALKHQGRRLYELARRGEEVERRPRGIHIYAIGLDSYDWPDLAFTVQCSKGTYIRTLLADIAAAAGTIGHVTALRRVELGPFPEERMWGFDALEASLSRGLHALDEHLEPIESALQDWRRVTVDADVARRLGQGRAVAADPRWPLGRVSLYTSGQGLFGIGEVLAGGQLVPRRLL